MAKDIYEVSLKVFLKNERGEVLILKAAENGSYAGFYDLPGGRIDVEEFRTPFPEIIAREIHEELGNIKFRLWETPVAVGRHLRPASMSKSGKEARILYLFFKAKYEGGEVRISDEHTGHGWVDLSDIELTEYFSSGILEGVRMYVSGNESKK